MLRSTFYSFTTALRGMNTAQKQLDVTGQNISNVGKTGYTRQRADVYSATPGGYGDRYGSRASNMVGQGSIIGSISQCRDPFLDIRYRGESADLGEQEAKLEAMDDLSMIFDEIEKDGLMTSFNDFVSKLQTLSNNAESPEFDSIARDAAQTLINQFNHYAKQVANVREEKEYNLSEVTVKSLNDLMTNIAGLNKSIREVQSNGGSALELKDERNLLLDQLSSFVKLDVKYSPKEVAGGIVVDDVTISMVGADGSKIPLIFNDTSSSFNVKTSGKDGTDKAIITVDTSALPAKQEVTKLNNILKAMSHGNMTLNSVKKELAQFYPDEFPANFLDTATSADLTTRLSDTITSLTDSISAAGGLNDQLADASQKVEDARENYFDKVNNGTATDADKELVNEAIKERSRIQNEREAAIKKKNEIQEYEKITLDSLKTLNDGDSALKNVMSQYGVTATQMWTQGDYSSCYYTFTDAGGNPLLGADGQAIQWQVGKTYTKTDRDGLAALGVEFTDSFDAESFGSPGALKGALDMLNREGNFDHDSSNIRGIGYYESMLDSLADKLATTLNALNDKAHTAGIKEDLFQTSDGSSKFTAANIRVSDDWLNGKYGITGTQTVSPGDNSAKNDNILLMISAISSRMQYSTGPIGLQDANGNYLKETPGGGTTIVADGRDKQGNYTLTKNPDGTVNDPPLLIANKDFINYVDDGAGNMVLDAKMLTPNADPDNPGTYLDDGGNIVANGKDKFGNYTMTTQDADGKDVVVTVANSDGVLYKKDANGKIEKDANGSPILDAETDNIDNRAASLLYNGTYQEFLSNISNVLSLDISSTSNLAANHVAVLGEIQDRKDSISSVSLDEEGVNIMQFQKAYNAAARLMTALDEAVERIINQMGTVGR